MITPNRGSKATLSNRYPSSNAFDVDGNPMDVIGWPGYRNSNNKSGLGYLETQAELGHMQGLFIRWLMLGKFRTRNPFYLLVIAAIGTFFGGIPLLLIVHEAFINGNWFIFILLLIFPKITVGLLLLVNVAISLVKWNGETITGD